MIEMRRGPGRPPKAPIDRQRHARPVRLDADVEDRLCVLSVEHEVSVHRLLKIAARMLAEADADELLRRLP